MVGSTSYDGASVRKALLAVARVGRQHIARVPLDSSEGRAPESSSIAQYLRRSFDAFVHLFMPLKIIQART
jgi:hypothetical protein